MPLTVSGSLTGAGDVTLDLSSEVGYGGQDNTVVISVSGTFTTAAGTFQGSADGVNFQNIAAIRLDTLALENTPTISDSTVRQWKVDCTNLRKVRYHQTSLATGAINVQLVSGFFPASPLPATYLLSVAGGTPFAVGTPTIIEVGSTNNAAANNQTLPGTSGKTTYLSGFNISGLGATSGSTITVTVTGLTNTLTYYVPIPAGATNTVTPVNVQFTPAIPASAQNTSIVVNVPSFGAGNLTAAVNAYGYQV